MTGRSTRGASTRGYPGSVEETADEVTRRGGTGIAVRCDHTSDDEVARLFAQVASEQDGRSRRWRGCPTPWVVDEPAREHGFTHIDGTQPPVFTAD